MKGKLTRTLTKTLTTDEGSRPVSFMEERVILEGLLRPVGCFAV